MITETEFGVRGARPWEMVSTMSTTGDVLSYCACGCPCFDYCEAVAQGHLTHHVAVAFPEP